MIAGNRGHGSEDPQFESPQQQESALFSNTILSALGATHPPIQEVTVSLPDGTAHGWGGGGGEVDQSPTYSAKVKNEWTCTSTPPMYLYCVNRENFHLLHKLIVCVNCEFTPM